MELSADTPQAHLTGESIHKVDIAKVLIMQVSDLDCQKRITEPANLSSSTLHVAFF